MGTSRAAEGLLVALLAVCCLPISTFALCLNYLYLTLFRRNPVHQRLRNVAGFRPKTILITGVSTPHGLKLARAFHYTGHRVVGADYEPGALPLHVRFSNALSQFHRLPGETVECQEDGYVARVVHMIEHEDADLWINCSNSAIHGLEAQARDAVEQHTRCQCFALRTKNMPYFASREVFLKYLASQGLPVPESYQVTSRAEIHRVLSKARGSRRYLLESMDQKGVNANTARTMLPSRTMSQTYDAVARITIANTTPWKLEQDINGLERYSTFAIIIKGSVRAFVASRSVRPGCYQALDSKSALHRSMLGFIHTFARKQGTEFTTHLGFDFCVDEQASESGVFQSILPIQVSVGANAATQLFYGMGGSISLARAYLSLFAAEEVNANGRITRPTPAIIQQEPLPDDAAIPDTRMPGIYDFGQDLLDLCFEPLRDFLMFRSSVIEFTRHIFEFLTHLMLWEEKTYDFQDPLPFWVAYQVYIPLRLIKSSLFSDNIRSR
ncbi:hypothetical protein G647_08301 [Cladophialophora carrionii CBS 160.54]|uniref:ATP-grasp domain-containing protein n=1 Tax=Cladophialophora carrionii CBS 160.54 TaxID=1279043 RepID=V9D2P8_9EURO|nr:uncharacterized protein G647_08301 [Cladophialophora carrionii CBS 160.54]ETI20267.1 hypothetical protein G647_08301 [Cladophialophora carrionii CBS 160.54]